MQKYLLVVLFKLREKRVQNAKHLFELFCHPSDPTLSQTVVGEIIEGEHVLLILDGFDEYPTSLLDEENCLVREIIGGSCLPKATVVVTSRPSAKASFATCQCKASKHIEIIGFTEEDRVKYVQSAFTSHPDMLVHFLKYSFSNPTIKAMMYIPLNCAIVAQIYKEYIGGGGGGKKLIPRTMTQLYTALCRSLLRRYLVENSLVNSDYRMPHDLNDLPQDVFKQLHTLSKIAFDGIEQQKLVFYKHELPDSFQHMGLMNECRELYVDRGAGSNYNFLHLSLQEYLAARHISQLPHMEQKDFFLDAWHFSHLPGAKQKRTSLKAGMFWLSSMSVVRRFLAGITGFTDAIWQDIQFYPETGELYGDMCTCLYETQNHILCQQLVRLLPDFNPSGIKSAIRELPRHFTSADFYAVGYCIAHSRSTWIIHAVSDSGAEGLEMLVSGLKSKSKKCIPTASIYSFGITDTDLSEGVVWLKELPLSQLSKLTLSRCSLCSESCKLLVQIIPKMPNLHSLDISHNHNVGPGGAVNLIESLCSLKHLEWLKINDIGMGIRDGKALINLIRTSKYLRKLHLSNPSFVAEQGFTDAPVMDEILFSALTIASLNELYLHDVTRSNTMQLSSLLQSNFSITKLDLYGCLQNDCIAYLSQALYANSHLTSITLGSFTWHDADSDLKCMHDLKFSKAEAMVLLITALQHNTGFINLKVHHRFVTFCTEYVSDIYDLQCLAHQLRRGPSGPQLKLKRAYSCPCLMKHSRHVSLESKPQLRRCCSAPDVALTESISSLHPSMMVTLGISQFYYKFSTYEKRDAEICFGSSAYTRLSCRETDDQ